LLPFALVATSSCLQPWSILVLKCLQKSLKMRNLRSIKTHQNTKTLRDNSMIETESLTLSWCNKLHLQPSKKSSPTISSNKRLTKSLLKRISSQKLRNKSMRNTKLTLRKSKERKNSKESNKKRDTWIGYKKTLRMSLTNIHTHSYTDLFIRLIV